MQNLILVLFLFVNGCALLQKANRVPAPPVVAFSRYLMISTCYHDEKTCREPVAQDLERANTSAPFIDGVAHNKVSITEQGQIFTGAITIAAKQEGFEVELTLHSGNTQTRAAEKVSFTVKNLNQLKEIVIMDKPISFKKGMLRAQLVFGPVLNITN